MALGGKKIMWIYEKKLEFPVDIKKPNAKIASVIMAKWEQQLAIYLNATQCL